MTMVVVIDCNVIVMCLTSTSPWHIIYQSLVSGQFHLAVTNEIILEYEEIIQEKYGIHTANAFITLLEELPNVHFITSYYKWQLIDIDPDDNKYCDCAIAGKAECLVTEDKHFGVLKNISFPSLSIISIDSFTAMLPAFKKP